MGDVRGLRAIRVGMPSRPPTGTVVVPGSKSLTNRLLLLAALAEGPSRLTGALDAEDTRLMIAALRRCGVDVEVAADGTRLDVAGIGGPVRQAPPGDEGPIDVGTSGTVARFLGAVLAASPGVTASLDGTPRMRERPLGQLFDALTAQGARIVAHGPPGFVPVTIEGARLAGGSIELGQPASSQIVSGLVLAAVVAGAPSTIVLLAGTPARPYVDMTLATVRAFGGSAHWVEGRRGEAIRVRPSPLVGGNHVVEPDASAATYAWGLAAAHRGDITVPGLGPHSLQGDARFAHDVLAPMGCDVTTTDGGIRVRGPERLRGIDVDLDDMPDPGLTLAALALRADGPTRIRGVAVHRHHETDRIAAAATELRRLGADVVEHDDGLDIVPPADGPRADVAVDTYLDHRMAMAFALVGEVVVNDPAVVAKTWPTYFAFLGHHVPIAPA